VSNAASFEVRSPVPSITTLSTTQSNAGEASLTLLVTGTGFVSNSRVRFKDVPVATRLVAAGVLEAILTEANLGEPGTFGVTVSNPAPGGGLSNALQLTLVAGAPEITLLPSRGATAGRSGFTLYIHGRHFLPGSVVRWNGVDRPTAYVGGTRITATVATSDVAQTGTAQITVVNPDGSATSAAVMTVRSLGSSTSTNQLVPLTARDLVFEPKTQRLYASIPGSSPTNPNSVVQIDPESGTITASVFVGSEPGQLALSDDGRFLYVGLNGANAVRRIELPAMSASLQWSLSPGQVAGDLHVAPGMPGTVAVSRHVPSVSPPLAGVTIYDEGIPRPTSSAGHTGGNRIEFLDSPSFLYGFNDAHTGFEFFTIAVDASGARHLSQTRGLIEGFDADIVGVAGRIYGTDGSIVDEERHVRIGVFPQSGALAVDPALGRAYILNGSQIGVYDLNTFGPLGSLSFPAPTFGHPATANTRLVRWGADGLAFLDQTRLFLIRSPLIGP
jgi:hypothetical protein